MSEKPILLVVDDEELIIELLTDLLEDDFTVVAATDGVRALKTLETLPAVQGIITDLHMPRMGGTELIERIRQSNSDVPILGLSVTIKPFGESVFKDIPCLQKPFEIDELLTLVRRLFQPSAH